MSILAGFLRVDFLPVVVPRRGCYDRRRTHAAAARTPSTID
jgi:hypothetical protein